MTAFEAPRAPQGKDADYTAIHHIKFPKLQDRQSWQRGDIPIRDNRGTIHYGVARDWRKRKHLLHEVAAWSHEVRPTLDRQTALFALDSL